LVVGASWQGFGVPLILRHILQTRTTEEAASYAYPD
jgi:hypothetical protein